MLERIYARVESTPESLIKFKAQIDVHVDPEIALFDQGMVDRAFTIADPREVEIPEALRDDLKECTPQALLRDLHRSEREFDKTFEVVDMAAEQRVDIVEMVATAMRTSLKLPPLGARRSKRNAACSPRTGPSAAGRGSSSRCPSGGSKSEEAATSAARITHVGDPCVETVVSEPRPIPVERFLLRAVGRTDVGAQRTQNEDAMYYDDFLGVYVVCDGMGGHASGQVASDIAIRTIVHSLKTGDPPPAPGQDPLTAAMKAANAAVFQRSLTDPACHGMGTTAVGLRFEEHFVHICHCGDSRAYLLRNGMLSQITRDHSLRNLYADRPDLVGTLGPATSNVIIRAVGLDASVEIEHNQGVPEHNDVYLLCCDGLSDLVDDWMIREIMTSGDALEIVAENLIRAANNNGGTDNITVVLVQTFVDPLWVPAHQYPQEMQRY